MKFYEYKKTITLLSSSQKGTANGIAELSTAGTVPASQLPSYVDDVIEGTINSDESTFTDSNGNIASPETGKIYVDNTTNKTYRWSGTKYIVIASDLALGETSSTAYAGNKGKALADKMGTTDISSIGSTVTEAITNLNTDKLNKTGDSKDNTATFTSSDVTDGSSTAWTTVPALTSGEKHTSIFSKMSQMFKNIRYLYKMLGTTDISAIGDGTATGAIHSLNSNLESVTQSTIVNLLKINNTPTIYSGITFTLNKDGSIHASGTFRGGQARCYLLSQITFPMDCIIGIRVKYGESSVQGDWHIWSDTLKTNIYSGHRCKSGTSTGGWFIYSEPSYGDEIDADLYVWVEPGYKLHNFIPYTGDTGYINSDLSASRAIIGDSDISSIGNGTITNAITTLESRITTLENS